MATQPLLARPGIVATMPRSIRIALVACALLAALGLVKAALALGDVQVPVRLRFAISTIWSFIPLVLVVGVVGRAESARATAFALSTAVAILLGAGLLVVPLVAAVTGMFPGELPTGALVLLVALHAAVAWGLSRRDAKAWFAATKA
jgi:hypothetical protein